MVLNKTYFPLIQSIGSLPETDALNLLCNLEPRAFNSVCECLREVVNNSGEIKISRKKFVELRKVLQPAKKEIRTIINPKTSVLAKKVVLRQRGGFIGALVASLLPIIIEQIIQLIKK